MKRRGGSPRKKGARTLPRRRPRVQALPHGQSAVTTGVAGQERAFTTVSTAIRAWVQPKKRRKGASKPKAIAWRPLPYGQRVLVFDLETTTDAAQRLLFGFFRLYDADRLMSEGIIAADVLDYEHMTALIEYSAKCRVPIFSRERFAEEIFYPEIYQLGTLCVGFNLPFDLARIAIHAGIGRGENRRKFRLVLSRRLRWHDLRIESLSGRAAFIGFVPKRKLYEWERPFFTGRFLDLATLAGAFTGKRHSLRSAGKAFRAFTRKMRTPELGAVDRRSLLYGRQDVRSTWALYKALRAEYLRHPFATFANDREKPDGGRYMGQLYSSASIAKQYLRLLGITPLLQKRPKLDLKYLGRGEAAYFGGRADVRVRKQDVPVSVLDFTAMYATIFCLQRLDKLLVAPSIGIRTVTPEIKGLVQKITADPTALFDPKIWPKLNCLVLVDPNWAILPVRFRTAEKDPYTIAVTPLETGEPRWYTVADVLEAALLGGPAPKIHRAIRFVPLGRRRSKTVMFRGKVPMRSNEPFFKPIVEERQIAKDGAEGDPDLAALETGLKEMSASGAYGIYAEVNVTPGKDDTDLPGDVYSDVVFPSSKVRNERPGAFTNPIVASLVTGGARLMLALLECEVTRRGGTFVFCDTDSLAVVCGADCPKGVPCLPETAIDEIVQLFDRLSPYDREKVPHLLKVEHAGIGDLRCFAISAKRYVLYRLRAGRRVQIVKAKESGLGAIIGRRRNETTPRLARRIWLSILMKHLRVNPQQRRRAKRLIYFDVPLRRKFPISQPSILQRLHKYNKTRSYDYRVKPFGFVQTVSPAITKSTDAPLPIAPFEADLAKSKGLEWVDFNNGGKPLRLDWSGSNLDGTLPVMRLSEYVNQYERHPEAKAADWKGDPAGRDTIGPLQRLRLRSKRLARIGKEVDRLDENEGAAFAPGRPVEYERNEIAQDIDYLAQFPQAAIAREIGMSERRWRDIVQGRTRPREATGRRIRRAAECRSQSGPCKRPWLS
ncbi:MAG: hypothetical protein JO307_26095 [Bryobacterales bacterium]|nr:hypothetical protein [Bryobacterales bacterium]